MKKSILTISLLACGFALPFSAQAAFKCWTNKEGVRECGNAIPPEYAQQKSETVNKQGMTVDVKERAKTQEELEEARRQEQLKQEEEKRRQEQEAYDRVLLSTFLTEKEIIESRDRKIGAIDASIEVTHISIDKLKKDLKQERKRAANLERKGKQIPKNLQKSIESLQRQINDKENYITSKEEEKAQLLEQYDRDMKRFRELKANGRRLR